MECREAQSLITSFIEDALTDEQVEAFISHIEGCTECYDELEVHYIVMTGLRQLDNDDHNDNSFTVSLKQYLESKKLLLSRKSTRNLHKKIAIIAGSIILAAILTVITITLVSNPQYFQTSFQKVQEFFEVEKGSISNETENRID